MAVRDTRLSRIIKGEKNTRSELLGEASRKKETETECPARQTTARGSLCPGEGASGSAAISCVQAGWWARGREQGDAAIGHGTGVQRLCP